MDATSERGPGRDRGADASRRRLAALAALAERSGGRAQVRSLTGADGCWTLALTGGGRDDVAVVLVGATGTNEARRALAAADHAVLAEVSVADETVRVRLAWLGGLVDVTATDWSLAPTAQSRS